MLSGSLLQIRICSLRVLETGSYNSVKSYNSVFVDHTIISDHKLTILFWKNHTILKKSYNYVGVDHTIMSDHTILTPGLSK